LYGHFASILQICYYGTASFVVRVMFLRYAYWRQMRVNPNKIGHFSGPVLLGCHLQNECHFTLYQQDGQR
jgi:hypothetical protein